MSSDSPRSNAPTRRRCLGYLGSLAATGFLAGCAGGSAGGSGGAETDADSPDSSSTPQPSTAARTTTATADDAAYTVSIEPVGDVTFASVPETWVANNGSWADMGIALGLEPPEGVWLPSRYHTHYYDAIPGVSVDIDGVRKLWGDGGVGKEQFYELDADVHVMDPNFLVNRGSWGESDVEEIRSGVGPFFGNSVFSRGYPWHDYRYYTLYEAFGKLAQAFRRTDRYEAFVDLHGGFQSNLAPVLPAPDERPAAAVVWGGGDAPEQFYPYVIDEGTGFKHLRDLGVRDALANTEVKDFHSNRGAIDFETLLDVDPEVLLLRGQEAKTRTEFESSVVAYMEDHDVASALTAVQNGDVYRAGPLYQGPITNLVVTERLAAELYGADDALFDPERVGAIVAGET